jgi:glycosyltransferase involved in cell wall biosynthesis
MLVNRGGFRGRVQELAFKYTGCSGKLTQMLRASEPALVHAHFGTDGCHAIPVAQSLGVPLIVTFHGYDATLRDAELKRLGWDSSLYVARRKALHNADLIICVSKFIRRQLLNQGFPEHKLLVHYIGTDTGLFTADPRMPRQPIVLFVGRLVEKKGCEYLIRAMEIVQQAAPGAELVIIGDGPQRSMLETLAKTTLRQYRFLGAQPVMVVREWMNRATLFSVPSITANSGDAEGFGMVFAEAQSMGLPVASFASGGIPEAVKNGETGLLAPERDVESLARNIVFLLAQRGVWSRFSEAGRQRVRQLFDLCTQSAALEQIYHCALKRDWSPYASG